MSLQVHRLRATLISYLRKSSDPPRLISKERRIAEELYSNPVPTSRLPFGLPTHTFIAEAEKRRVKLPRKQHLALYLFKKRLLRVMPSKVNNNPEYALFCVHTVAEMHLHMFMAEECLHIARQLPKIVTHLRQYGVAEEYQTEKM
jgi:hypothetical protein